MPELPEVETVRRDAESRLCGKKIVAAEVRNDDILDGITAEEMEKLLVGNGIVAVGRRGKYLIFTLASGEELLLHLRMTGQLIAFDATFDEDRHCHLVVRFERGGFFYRDVRRFGRFCPLGVGAATEKGLSALGREPLDDDFTLAYLREGLARRRCPIKARILDQRFIAGIGNIYADEILFRAGIHPLCPCAELSPSQIKRLKKACETVLREAIEDRGTTFRDFRAGDGGYGGHQERLAVYQRAGKACGRCGAAIAATKCGGRTTSYCPKCQKR